MRSDKRTRLEVIEEVYSDFPINFDRNPITGVLARVTNDDAVKSSLRNLVLTETESWPHHPTLGGNLYKLLFEPLDRTTALMIRDAVSHVCSKETRAQILEVAVDPVPDQNGFAVSIRFNTINSTEVQTLSAFLKRIR